ncbi:hypothetical protein Arcve_2144 [Archaeoglobus veneficus SNP6]|uniref:Uncharacterized protein n=2 Tax=Archaeoglobus veneficus TaxID=58290 RepID=F2KSY9_ARCVS|nr:hypothetical protein Arcve_2144 [Archaeoglobus veneficus SNP6]
MLAYVKLAETFGVPPSISERVAEVLSGMDESMCGPVLLDEFDELVVDAGETIAALVEELGNLNAICTAINLYAFCTGLEKKMREIGLEEVEACLSDVFKLKELISSVELPHAPIYHHPFVRTVWQNMEPLVVMKMSDIVREIAEEIWRERF